MFLLPEKSMTELCNPVNSLAACISQKQKSVCFTAVKHFLGSKQILLLRDNSKISSNRKQGRLFRYTMNLHQNFDTEQSYWNKISVSLLMFQPLQNLVTIDYLKCVGVYFLPFVVVVWVFLVFKSNLTIHLFSFI